MIDEKTANRPTDMYEYSGRTREAGSRSTSFKPRLPRTHSARLGLKFRLVDRRKEAFNPAWLGRARARERERRESSTEGRQSERKKRCIYRLERGPHTYPGSYRAACPLTYPTASSQHASFNLLLFLPIDLVSWLVREGNARTSAKLRSASERDARGRTSSGLGSLEETAVRLLEVDHVPLVVQCSIGARTYRQNACS